MKLVLIVVNHLGIVDRRIAEVERNNAELFRYQKGIGQKGVVIDVKNGVADVQATVDVELSQRLHQVVHRLRVLLLPEYKVHFFSNQKSGLTPSEAGAAFMA
ncbi:hypothetical protein D9M71_498670 [compost metagenome]